MKSLCTFPGVLDNRLLCNAQLRFPPLPDLTFEDKLSVVVTDNGAGFEAIRLAAVVVAALDDDDSDDEEAGGRRRRSRSERYFL